MQAQRPGINTAFHRNVSYTTSHGNASHTCVQHHWMIVCVRLYVYDCMCMIVWQGSHDVMMTIIRPYTVSNSVSSNMIASVSIHVGCLPKINKQSCYLQEWNGMEWTHQHLSRHREHFPGPWFIYLRAAPLHGCMCMIVSVWLYVYDCMTMCVWCCHDDHKTIYN